MVFEKTSSHNPRRHSYGSQQTDLATKVQTISYTEKWKICFQKGYLPSQSSPRFIDVRPGLARGARREQAKLRAVLSSAHLKNSNFFNTITHLILRRNLHTSTFSFLSNVRFITSRMGVCIRQPTIFLTCLLPGFLLPKNAVVELFSRNINSVWVQLQTFTCTVIAE